MGKALKNIKTRKGLYIDHFYLVKGTQLSRESYLVQDTRDVLKKNKVVYATSWYLTLKMKVKNVQREREMKEF